MSRREGNYARIYAVVRRIPRGRVATYGQIAQLAGLAGHARQVGYALNAMPDDAPIPWHRVINAKGEISTRSFDTGGVSEQRRRLEAEGVVFDDNGRVPLKRFQWRPHT
jgi:methylated-DNA-protein-cysteine methyltransferase-like protein